MGNALQLPPEAAKLNQHQKQKLLYKLCAADFSFWLKHYGVIVDETGDEDDADAGGVIHIGIDLWPGVRGYTGQDEYVDLLLKRENVITGKARQLGASWLPTNFDCWEMLFKDNIRLSVIAQNDEYAIKHIGRLKAVYRNQPKFLRRKLPVVGYDNKHTFGIGTLHTMSVCDALIPDPDTARGISARRVRCEEFAHWHNAAEVYLALRGTTADAGRQVLIVTTANGEGNKYYELWNKASSGTIPLKTVFFPWDTHPGRDPDFKRRMIEEHGKAYADQEWPDDPEQMFQSSGSRYFDIAATALLAPREPLRTERNGQCLIYQEPQPGKLYVLGADVADGGGDACAASVKDVVTGRTVAELHSSTWKAGEFGHELIALAYRYNEALLIVERMGPGYAALEVIMTARYPYIYCQQKWDELQKGWREGDPGWLTNKSTRPILLSTYDEALRLGDTAPAGDHSIREVRIFQHNPRTKRPDAPDGAHDDCVFAEAICWQGVLYVRAYKPQGPVEAYLGGQKIA